MSANGSATSRGVAKTPPVLRPPSDRMSMLVLYGAAACLLIIVLGGLSVAVYSLGRAPQLLPAGSYEAFQVYARTLDSLARLEGALHDLDHGIDPMAAYENARLQADLAYGRGQHMEDLYHGTGVLAELYNSWLMFDVVGKIDLVLETPGEPGEGRIRAAIEAVRVARSEVRQRTDQLNKRIEQDLSGLIVFTTQMRHVTVAILGIALALSAVLVTVLVVLGRTLRNLRNTQHELRRQATTDPLTGLLNRRAFFELANRSFSLNRRHDDRLAIAILDIDRFKRINDTLGHAAGDEAIRALADICGSEVRDSDVIARFGGEEFVVLLDRSDGPGARILAERLRVRIEETTIPWAAQPFSMTISVGCATLQEGDRDIDDIIARADMALYAAKNGGRNRVVLATDGTEHPSDGAGI